MIDDGSIPGPTKVVWNVTPSGMKGVAGLGGGTENDPADAAAGHSSPLPARPRGSRLAAEKGAPGKPEPGVV